MVSDPAQSGYTCKSPGIAYNDEAVGKDGIPNTVVGIVWEMDNGTSIRKIGCRIYDSYSHTWSAPFYLKWPSDYPLQPVITSSKQE